jgi:enoyl-CoA hydratase/carnithine racemase
MIYESILYEVDETILTVTLNRADRLNAFTLEMANELMHAFARAGEDDNISAVVVTGAGRAFCAGMDLSLDGNAFGLDEAQSPVLDDVRERLADPVIMHGVRDLGGRLTLAIFDCNKPVIAAINGPAVGIGATMTLAMDVRIAADNAKIGFVFGKLGIVNEGCSSWFLPRIVGMPQALEWLYSAEMIDSAAAQRSGLVKAVYPAERLLEEASRLAHKFTDDKSPVATMLIRHMLYRNSAQIHPLEAHRIESLAMFYASIGDGKEGVNAFLEKRKPIFKSKVTKPPPFFPWWE